jgi:hypothetical protein
MAADRGRDRGADFFFYWMHRAKHRWNWLWRLHETHHSSRDLDWFSSVRFNPLEKILDRTVYLFPLTFLGAGEQALLILSIVDAGVATFSHANIRMRIGPLIYVFVGPRCTAGTTRARSTPQRSNFGNNLSIFDWIFGTPRLRPGRTRRRSASDDDSFPEATSCASSCTRSGRAKPSRPRSAGSLMPGAAALAGAGALISSSPARPRGRGRAARGAPGGGARSSRWAARR